MREYEQRSTHLWAEDGPQRGRLLPQGFFASGREDLTHFIRARLKKKQEDQHMNAIIVRDGSSIDHGNHPVRFGRVRAGLMVAAGMLLMMALPVWAGDTNSPPSVIIKPYPIDHCLICGDNISGTNAVVVFDYQGQELKFCCQRCVKTFKKDPAKYLQQLHGDANSATARNEAPAEENTTH